MKKQTILTILLLMISSNLAFATNSYTILTDKYGNYAGAVRRVPNSNTYNETDKNGNHTRTYRKIGSMTYVYDKNGNCISSFRNEVGSGRW